MHDIAALQQLKISRCLAPTGRAGELHTFVDASETAYAAAVYWRTTSSNGEVHIALMAGKARVAPVKITSIPRLELQAALLGARLAATVSEETDLEITSRVFWSDSTTVLHWLKSDPRRFKTFVAHRLAEIEDKTKPRDWRWVPTKENPADDATRDIPRNFESSSRWFIGPDFLYKPKDEWPVSKISAEASPDDDEEWKKSTCATARVIHALDLFNFSRFSSWTRLLRTVARVHMFVDQCRRSKEDFKKGKSNNRMWLPIEADYLKKAEETIIKQSQNESFKKEMVYLKSGKPIENSSRLKKIDVILQEDGMLRLNARTTKIQDLKNEATKLPILDGRSHVSQLLIKHWHERMHHGNHATVINELRQRYWLLSLRDAVRRVAHQCQMCRIKRTQPRKPPLGDLPPERLAHHQPPFTHTGVDYFGPMYVVIGRRKEKRWGALFTCLSTRAIHLELAASLSTSSMIMALRRMASRRGSPRTLYSDNGTNFVGANNELREEMKKMRTEDLERAAEEEGLKWKFIPPGAPSMGGAWERMVRSVKTALTAVLRERNPPEEVLYTLLTEVEHTVNSRPLTHISADPGDEEALTPNHFLIGRSCGAAILGNFNDKELIGRPNWKTAQRLADHFWTRWLREYLPTLMPRRLSGEDVTYHKGDIVIIADSSLPRNTWPRGVVEEVFPGPDGRIRIMNVRTKGGLMRRPASRLIKVSTSLPEDGVPGRPCTGGETVADVS